MVKPVTCEKPASPRRPARLSLPDFAGRTRTLPDEASAWECVQKPCRPSCLVILGVGPGNPTLLPFAQEAEKKGIPIYWLESQAMLPHINRQSFNWTEIGLQEMIALGPDAEAYFYKPGMAFAPDFWGPILAGLDSAGRSLKKQDSVRTAWLPGNDNLLLHQELRVALRKSGFQTIFQNIPEIANMSALDRLWHGIKPDFALSVNFRGLDPQGRIFELCERLRIPLAIWLVDNPWNLLSAIPLPWWRRANIFVTDASFIDSLKKNGALNARFCPLAYADHMWRPPSSAWNPNLLFVGRSAFPDRQGFFRGLRIPENAREKATGLLTAGRLPDYHWWARQFRHSPWPGLAARETALGADEFSAINRARWLKAAASHKLEIIGDAGWKNFFPDLSISPPVDYYGKLPQLYGNAFSVLNVTSLLLPGSLNQRHFDVWAAGGFMLGEYTPGLEIFPKELTAPVSMVEPAELAEKIAWLGSNPQKRRELQTAWRELLQKIHNYSDRIQFLLGQTGNAAI